MIRWLDSISTHKTPGRCIRTSRLALLVLAIGVSLAGTALAEDDPGAHHHAGHGDGLLPRPDDYAPIGVMGQHTHPKGGFMASYRFMRMHMQGNRVGTTQVGVPEVLTDYMVSPTEMDMDMHMFGLMWAPSDRVTLMAMIPFLDVSMTHISRMGAVFETDATGLGDIGIGALVELFAKQGNQLILNAGMTFPSGSIDRTDITPMSAPDTTLLPYPMQLGSGTWDLKPGLTYNGRMDWLSWGSQAIGTFRIGTNEQVYRRGHEYLINGWGAWKALDWVSVSARLEWRQWFNYSGRDTRLMGPPFVVVPTADPSLRAGKRLDIGPGLNFVIPGQFLRGVRLAVEMLFPVYQDLDGPQLQSDWTLVVGTQYDW
ncbi:MAG: transporter [Deltaproteobacteria bacterium]|nr:transporter [Deltaproteobacteria bacterium]MBW2697187.1 transporter [Deltaproteobacteria bacterium]